MGPFIKSTNRNMTSYSAVSVCVLCVFAIWSLTSAEFSLSFGCQDSLSNCAAYGQSVCTDINYKQWVNDNCRSFCGKCSGGSQPMIPTLAPAVPAASSGCQDSLSNCAAYGQSVCTDANYKQWVNDNCRSFCGQCSGASQPNVPTSAPVVPSNCQDSLPNCDAYGQNVCSDPAYTQWANDNCRSFCGKCSASSPGQQPA